MSIKQFEAATSDSELERRRGPLHGVRVLDLTRIIMGPLSTHVLADQGATVIMIETEAGDGLRLIGDGRHPELSGVSLNLLRNKQSVSVDLKSAEGMDLVRRLAATCDVVVSTMRPDAIRRLGLAYEDIKTIKPDVVYCQAQGWPLGSPEENEPAYDDIIQAATGAADLMERISGSPNLMPTIIADKVSGLYMAQAITAALYHHSRTGEGQHVVIAMTDAMREFMLVEHGSGAICEPPVQEAGYSRILSAERRPHPTKDGWIHIQPYLPKHFSALFEAVGRQDLVNDPRFADRRSTLQNSDSLYRDVRDVAARFTTSELMAFCKSGGIPVTEVKSVDQMVRELPLTSHPVVGSYRTIPPAATFSRTPTGPFRPAPLVGADEEIVREELTGLEHANG